MSELGARCRDCEWTATAPGAARDELNRSMINHFLESGHTIVRDECEEQSHPSIDGFEASALEYE